MIYIGTVAKPTFKTVNDDFEIAGDSIWWWFNDDFGDSNILDERVRKNEWAFKGFAGLVCLNRVEN